MGEIPKKEAEPLSDKSPKAQGPSALFSSPKSFPLFLCCSAVAVIGGFLCYATTRPAPVQLSDVTRSPLGFDVADLDEEEDGGLLAVTTGGISTSTSTSSSIPTSTYSSSTGSTSSSHTTPSPTTTTTTPPVKMPARHGPRQKAKQETDEPFEDPQIYDDEINREHVSVNDTTEFQSRIDMLEQEIHQLRSVLAQRERMIAQLSKELTESRAAPQVVPQAAVQPAAPLEPVARQVSRTHIVQKGETLSEIAMTYYGNRGAWGKIYRANAEKLPDKNRLPVGALLIIPE